MAREKKTTILIDGIFNFEDKGSQGLEKVKKALTSNLGLDAEKFNEHFNKILAGLGGNLGDKLAKNLDKSLATVLKAINTGNGIKIKVGLDTGQLSLDLSRVQKRVASAAKQQIIDPSTGQPLVSSRKLKAAETKRYRAYNWRTAAGMAEAGNARALYEMDRIRDANFPPVIRRQLLRAARRGQFFLPDVDFPEITKENVMSYSGNKSFFANFGKAVGDWAKMRNAFEADRIRSSISDKYLRNRLLSEAKQGRYYLPEISVLPLSKESVLESMSSPIGRGRTRAAPKKERDQAITGGGGGRRGGGGLSEIDKASDGARKYLRETDKISESVSGIHKHWGRIGETVTRFALYGGLFFIVYRLKDIMKASFEWQLALEQIQLGFAETLSVSSRLVDKFSGQELSPFAQMAEAFREAQQAMSDILKNAIDFGVPAQKLAEAFAITAGAARQGGIAPEQSVRVITQLLILAERVQIPMNVLARDVRDIFTGLNVSRTVLGNILGLTEEQIKSWKKQNILGDELEKKLGIIKLTAYENLKTFNGLENSIVAILQQMQKTIAFPVFDVIKKMLTDFRQNLLNISKSKELTMQWLTAMKNLAQSLKEAGNTIVNKIIPATKTLLIMYASFKTMKVISNLAGGAAGYAVRGYAGYKRGVVFESPYSEVGNVAVEAGGAAAFYAATRAAARYKNQQSTIPGNIFGTGGAWQAYQNSAAMRTGVGVAVGGEVAAVTAGSLVAAILAKFGSMAARFAGPIGIAFSLAMSSETLRNALYDALQWAWNKVMGVTPKTPYAGPNRADDLSIALAGIQDPREALLALKKAYKVQISASERQALENYVGVPDPRGAEAYGAFIKNFPKKILPKDLVGSKAQEELSRQGFKFIDRDVIGRAKSEIENRIRGDLKEGLRSNTTNIEQEVDILERTLTTRNNIVNKYIASGKSGIDALVQGIDLKGKSTRVIDSYGNPVRDANGKYVFQKQNQKFSIAGNPDKGILPFLDENIVTRATELLQNNQLTDDQKIRLQSSLENLKNSILRVASSNADSANIFEKAQQAIEDNATKLADQDRERQKELYQMNPTEENLNKYKEASTQSTLKKAENFNKKQTQDLKDILESAQPTPADQEKANQLLQQLNTQSKSLLDNDTMQGLREIAAMRIDQAIKKADLDANKITNQLTTDQEILRRSKTSVDVQLRTGEARGLSEQDLAGLRRQSGNFDIQSAQKEITAIQGQIDTYQGTKRAISEFTKGTELSAEQLQQIESLDNKILELDHQRAAKLSEIRSIYGDIVVLNEKLKADTFDSKLTNIDKLLNTDLQQQAQELKANLAAYDIQGGQADLKMEIAQANGAPASRIAKLMREKANIENNSMQAEITNMMSKRDRITQALAEMEKTVAEYPGQKLSEEQSKQRENYKADIQIANTDIENTWQKIALNNEKVNFSMKEILKTTIQIGEATKTGLARGIGDAVTSATSLKDFGEKILGGIGSAMSSVWQAALEKMIADKLDFDKEIEINFLKDIPGWMSEGGQKGGEGFFSGMVEKAKGVFNGIFGDSSGNLMGGKGQTIPDVIGGQKQDLLGKTSSGNLNISDSLGKIKSLYDTGKSISGFFSNGQGAAFSAADGGLTSLNGFGSGSVAATGAGGTGSIAFGAGGGFTSTTGAVASGINGGVITGAGETIGMGTGAASVGSAGMAGGAGMLAAAAPYIAAAAAVGLGSFSASEWWRKNKYTPGVSQKKIRQKATEEFARGALEPFGLGGLAPLFAKISPIPYIMKLFGLFQQKSTEAIVRRSFKKFTENLGVEDVVFSDKLSARQKNSTYSPSIQREALAAGNSFATSFAGRGSGFGRGLYRPELVQNLLLNNASAIGLSGEDAQTYVRKAFISGLGQDSLDAAILSMASKKALRNKGNKGQRKSASALGFFRDRDQSEEQAIAQLRLLGEEAIRVYTELPKSIDAAALATKTFTANGQINLESLKRTVEDLNNIVSATGEYFNSAIKTGDFQSAGIQMGDSIVNGIISRMQERLFANNGTIGKMMTELGMMANSAAEKYMSGDIAGGRMDLKNVYQLATKIQTETLKTTAPFYADIQGLIAGFGGSVGPGLVNQTGFGFGPNAYRSYATPSFTEIQGPRGMSRMQQMHGQEGVRSPEQEDKILKGIEKLNDNLSSLADRPMNYQGGQIIAYITMPDGSTVQGEVRTSQPRWAKPNGNIGV